jgi:hypothetical protein
LIAKLNLQSKLNLHSSNHSGELLAETQGSVALLAPKGFQTHDYVSTVGFVAPAPVPASKKSPERRGVAMRNYTGKKQSTANSSRDGGSVPREAGVSDLTYRGSLGRSKGPKGNEDISHFLKKSSPGQ